MVPEDRSLGEGVDGSDLEAVVSLLLCSPCLLPLSGTSKWEVSPRLDRSFSTGAVRERRAPPCAGEKALALQLDCPGLKSTLAEHQLPVRHLACLAHSILT